MLDTISRYLEGLTESKFRYALKRIFNPIADRISSQALTSAGLVINAGGATFAKTGTNITYATAGGLLVQLAAGTAMPALTGITTLAGGYNVACFFVNSAGVVTVAGGQRAATLAGVGWPQFPVGCALIGILIISGAGAFTGGTTPLDTATTVYLSPVGAFDPTVLL